MRQVNKFRLELIYGIIFLMASAITAIIINDFSGRAVAVGLTIFMAYCCGVLLEKQDAARNAY
jgi:hypothetical protein